MDVTLIAQVNPTERGLNSVRSFKSPTPRTQHPAMGHPSINRRPLQPPVYTRVWETWRKLRSLTTQVHIFLSQLGAVNMLGFDSGKFFTKSADRGANPPNSSPTKSPDRFLSRNRACFFFPSSRPVARLRGRAVREFLEAAHPSQGGKRPNFPIYYLTLAQDPESLTSIPDRSSPIDQTSCSTPPLGVKCRTTLNPFAQAYGNIPACFTKFRWCSAGGAQSTDSIGRHPEATPGSWDPDFFEIRKL